MKIWQYFFSCFEDAPSVFDQIRTVIDKLHSKLKPLSSSGTLKRSKSVPWLTSSTFEIASPFRSTKGMKQYLNNDSYLATAQDSQYRILTQRAQWIIVKRDKKDDVAEVMKEFAIPSKELFLQCKLLNRLNQFTIN
jgi:hypothetical protein